MSKPRLSSTTRAWRIAALTLALLGGCGGGGDTTPDAGPRDGGPPDRRTPQDVDGDEWPNEADNCPMDYNPEQRDRDRDGVGDTCDSCAATPNGGASGQPGQDACSTTAEVEPNDMMPQSVTLPDRGRVAVVRGVIERQSGAAGPVDRFQLMLGAQTMVHLRVARAGLSSLIEPELVVTGGGFTAARHADGLFVAERDVYVSAAGTYQIEVRDRRSGANIGGDAFGYELSATVRDVVPDTLALPVSARQLLLSPAGKIGVYAVELMAAQRTRVLVSTALDKTRGEGIDPIVVVEGPDGALLGESDDYVANKRDARFLGPFPGGVARVVVDHARIIGTDALDLELTIDQPPDNFEVEPNDDPDMAGPLVYPGQSRGQIDAPTAGRPDVDVWSVDLAAGTVASFRGLVDANSLIDPYVRVARRVGDDLEVMYENADFSGPSARVEAIFPQAGTYYVVVTDQANEGMGAPRGGSLFPYTLFSERLGIQPQAEISQSGSVDAVLDQGGRLLRYLVTASVGPSLLEVHARDVALPDDTTPVCRVYRPGVTGLLAEGESDVSLILPVAGAYVLGVHNGNQGKGGLGFGLTLDVVLVGLAEVVDTEPNDTNAQPVAGLPSALVGRVEPETDVDRYALSLEARDRLAVTVHPPVADLSLALYAPGNGAPVAAGLAAIAGYRAPAAGTYVLEVTGGSAADYQVAVRRR